MKKKAAGAFVLPQLCDYLPPKGRCVRGMGISVWG